MNTSIKIGIVEDELLIAEKIKTILANIGYAVCEPVTNFDDAIDMIHAEKPDMLLLDIIIDGKKDGVDIAAYVNEKYGLPFIFLTANSDAYTIQRTKTVKPYAYLVKPFTKDELYTSIEIAFNNYSNFKNAAIKATPSSKQKDFLFIKEAHCFVKIMFDDIVYFESQENYIKLFTIDKKNSILRSTFSDFLSQLPTQKFVRTHRSFAVQLGLIDKMDPTEVVAKGFKIPVSNSYRRELYSLLGINE